MKSIKLILPVIAFAVAIVTAFASDLLPTTVKGATATVSCRDGVLIDPPSGSCLTTNNTNRCQVTIQDDESEDVIAPAFSAGGTCASNQALYYTLVP